MNDDELRGLFQEMRDEPVPAESLARVRSGVSQRIGARRTSPWRGGWKWGSLAALVATAVVVAAWLWPQPEAAPPAPEPIPVVSPAPPPAPMVPPPAPASKPKPAPRPQVITRAQPKPPVSPVTDVVFRIQTDDPEVVILLVN